VFTFTIRRKLANVKKLTVGLVLLPDDIALLAKGQPQFTQLAEVGAENDVVESVGVYLFRDMHEFQEAMRAAGVEPRLVMGD
jgi:hypothetical protein